MSHEKHTANHNFLIFPIVKNVYFFFPQAPVGNQLRFNVLSYDIANSFNCNNDRLIFSAEINTGNKRYCGTSSVERVFRSRFRV